MPSELHILVSLAYSAKMLLALVVFFVTIFIIGIPLVLLSLRWRFISAKKRRQSEQKRLKVGIFHPYCNAGGGGEKVLWVAVQALQQKYPKADFYIYTGDVEATPAEIIERAEKNLNVKLERTVRFIYLHRRKWVESHMYPYFTLLGQSLGSVHLGFEALGQLTPDVFIETTGFAFTLPLFKYMGGCKTACYVHYPTITKEMLKRVAQRNSMYNNRGTIARSPFLTVAKTFYYRIFAAMYSWAGYCSDTSLVNSTFTLEHLNALWHTPLHLVYPPCEVAHLKAIPRDARPPAQIRILSLAQFRPEKDHPLQLQALYELRELLTEEQFARITLVLCGSCRHNDDAVRVKDLRDLSRYLSLEEHVEFRVNVTYGELMEEFARAYIGLHTMLDEHFGIGVVELMAAGLVTIAHKSGGPYLDIVETSEASRLGFLAVTADEYAHTIKHVLELGVEEVVGIRERARASVDRFATGKFQEEFLRAIEPVFK